MINLIWHILDRRHNYDELSCHLCEKILQNWKVCTIHKSPKNSSHLSRESREQSINKSFTWNANWMMCWHFLHACYVWNGKTKWRILLHFITCSTASSETQVAVHHSIVVCHFYFQFSNYLSFHSPNFMHMIPFSMATIYFLMQLFEHIVQTYNELLCYEIAFHSHCQKLDYFCLLAGCMLEIYVAKLWLLFYLTNVCILCFYLFLVLSPSRSLSLSYTRSLVHFFALSLSNTRCSLFRSLFTCERTLICIVLHMYRLLCFIWHKVYQLVRIIHYYDM